MEAITKNEEPVNGPKYNQLKDMNITKYFRDQEPPQFGKDDKTKWRDPLFSPEEDSLLTEEYKKGKLTSEQQVQVKQEIVPEKIEWKRFSDVLDDYFHIFEDKIEISDIIQGGLSDCYLLSALAALSQYPDYIFQIVRTKDPSPNGVYEVLLFIDGEWQIVLVDDYFPYEKGTNNLMFTKTNGTELWVILLEKAWAKINGGYANIVLGQVSDAFQALTGFAIQVINLSWYSHKEIWENLTNSNMNNYIMCSSTVNEYFLYDVNLVKGHYYFLIKAKEVNYSQQAFQLIQLYNPWGRHEWNGDWSDNSPLWNDELKKLFGKPEREDLQNSEDGIELIKNYQDAQNPERNLEDGIKPSQNMEDGQFFMDVNDYIKYFDTIYICNMMYGASLKTFDIPAKWARKPLVFTFTLIDDCNVSLSVFFKHWRFNRDLQGIIRPFSLVFARIKEEDLEVEYFDGDYSAIEDIQASRRLLKGKYVVWLYSIAEEVIEENFSFKFRISADQKYSVVFVGEDKDLKIIKYLILSNRKRIMKETKGVSDIELKEDSEVKKAGLRAFYGINKYSNSKTHQVQFSFGAMRDVRLLEDKYKYVRKTEPILLHPGHDILILGAKLGKEKDDRFAVLVTKKELNEKYEVVAQDISFWNDLNSPVDAEKLKIQEYSFSSVDDLRFPKPFETMGKKKKENYTEKDLSDKNEFAAKEKITIHNNDIKRDTDNGDLKKMDGLINSEVEISEQMQKNYEKKKTDANDNKNKRKTCALDKRIDQEMKETIGESGKDLCTISYFKEKMIHNEEVTCLISFKLDEKILMASGGKDFSVKVWDPITGQRKMNFTDHIGEITCLLNIQSEGRNLIASGSGGEDKTIRLWDVESKKCFGVLKLKGQKEISCLINIKNEGRNLIASVGKEDKTITLWNVDSKQCVGIDKFKGHTEEISCLINIQSEGRNLFASGSKDETIRLWDVDSQKCIGVLTGHIESITCLLNIQSKGENLIVSGSKDKTIRLWNMDSQKCVGKLEGQTDEITCLINIPTLERNLIAGCMKLDKTIKLFDVDSKESVGVLEGFSGLIKCLLNIQIGGRNIIASCMQEDKEIRLWDMQFKEFLNVQEYKISDQLVYEHDNNIFIVIGFEKGFIHVWKYLNENSIFVAYFRGHTEKITSLSQIPNLNLFSSVSKDKTIGLWDVDQRKCVAYFEGLTAKVTCLTSIQIEGKNLIACGSEDNTIRLWDLDSKYVGKLKGHEGAITCLINIEMDGKNFLASGSEDKTIKIWDVDKKENIRTQATNSSSISSKTLIFAHEKILFAEGSKIKTWTWKIDDDSKENNVEELSLNSEITCMIHIPIEEKFLIAYCCKDNEVKQWNFDESVEKLILKNEKVFSLEFSVLGLKKMIVVGLLKSIKILDAISFECIGEIKKNEERLEEIMNPPKLIEAKHIIINRWNNDELKVTLLSYSKTLQTGKGHNNYVCSGPLFSPYDK